MKNTKLFLFSVISLLLIAGCHTPSPKQEAGAPSGTATNAEANLTQAEAAARSAAVSNVKYQLHIDLDDHGETFAGQSQTQFDLAAPAHGLFLDFKNGATIESATINGKPLSVTLTNHRVTLPDADLKTGTNTVEIKYRQAYANNGRGLHKFVDPEDKRVYLHSQFEAYDAHHMFPCFDQPDIKATMRMTVSAPKSWQVITTTRETAKNAESGKTVWTFAETPRMSSYLFSLIAGPYYKWETRAGDIPLRLFARQSLHRWVNVRDWFTPTRAGLEFYGKYFDYPYPYKKYDQLIVPEFNAGAMENIAAVTFTERLVMRGPTTYEERERLASVILHEMAHMWFGDLVTMKWWNDIWLNESFATYMSSLAMANATEFKDVWANFYAHNKTGAYIADQLVTTHPVSGTVPDTQSAFATFDSITYGKGASVLKQLSYYLGEDNFKAGVRAYFKKHAYQNTELKDFIGALEEASKKDLTAWSKSWLQTAGVDTVEAEYTCSNGKISSFALKARAPEGQTETRAHRTEIALYSDKGGKITPYKTVSVEYHGPSTQAGELVGEACPAMVYPNENDYDYVKVSLDSRTLGLVKDKLALIPSPFTRMLFWPNLYSMVRDVKLAPQDFLKIVEQNLPKETDLAIGDIVTRFMGGVLYYLPQSTPIEKQARDVAVQNVENMLWKKITDKKSNSDWKKLALNSLIDVTESGPGRDRLIGLLEGKVKVAKLNVDPDQQWEMIIRLAALGDSRVNPILAHQREKDKTERGENSALAAEAAVPALPIKQAWWNRIVEKNDLSLTQKADVLWHFLPSTQADLRQSLAPQFYEQLPSLVSSHDDEFLTMFSSTLAPTTCTETSAHKLAEFIQHTSDKLPAPVLKSLRVSQQEDSRCVAIRAHAASVVPATSRVQ